MGKFVSTKAEFKALPIGSIIAMSGGWAPWFKTPRGWCVFGTARIHSNKEMAISCTGTYMVPYTVLRKGTGNREN